MRECSLQIMGRNLTPIMLVAGPLLFMGAFFQWPITNEVGMDAVNLLDDRGLLMLAVGGILGMSLTFAGLHLLSMDMKKGLISSRPNFSTWQTCSSSAPLASFLRV